MGESLLDVCLLKVANFVINRAVVVGRVLYFVGPFTEIRRIGEGEHSAA
ncbi:hypothetical protein AB1L42_02615 [Thalassoglobus sp. JC818]